MDATALLTHLHVKHDPGAVAEALDGENPAACATRIRSVSGRTGVANHESNHELANSHKEKRDL